MSTLQVETTIPGQWVITKQHNEDVYMGPCDHDTALNYCLRWNAEITRSNLHEFGGSSFRVRRVE